MKTFQILFIGRVAITVKAASVGKIMEGAVILHDENGEVVACFNLEQIAGIVEVGAVAS